VFYFVQKYHFIMTQNSHKSY